MVDALSGPGEVEVHETPVAASERSPADVLRVVVSAATLVVLLLLQWVFGDELVENGGELLRGLDAVPSWLVTAVVIVTWFTGAALLAGGAIVALVQRRWRRLTSAIVAAGVALALASLVGLPDEPTSEAVTDHGDIIDWFVENGATSELVLAVMAAVATAVAPWISRRWRRVAWAVVIGVMLSRALVAPVGFTSVRALLVGWFAGALTVVLLGAPPRRAGGVAIAAGLAAVGVPVRRIDQASLDARGSTPYFAEGSDGQRLFVKALGRDERSADLLFRLYRRIVPRDLGDERGYLSLRRAVEHEALVALVARDLGSRTPHLIALASAEPASFVLAYEAVEGRSLDRVDPADLGDELLAAIWTEVRLLRRHRVAHRDLRLANVFVAADGGVWMIDFGFSELAASDTLLAADVAELLAATSLSVGVDRAVDVAVAVLGPAAIATAAPRLQPWALSGATRTAMKDRPGLLDALRARVTDVAPAPATVAARPRSSGG